jgi:hypothetical protein
MKQDTENKIKILKAKNEGQDINTANGKKGQGKTGRPNETGENWDENGNYEGRNGWKDGEEHA